MVCAELLGEAAGQEYEQRPVGRRAARARDAAPEDEELLAQESVLGDEGVPTAHEVGERAHRDGRFGGFRRGGQALPERANQGLSALGTLAEQASQHQGAPHRRAVAKPPHRPVAR